MDNKDILYYVLPNKGPFSYRKYEVKLQRRRGLEDVGIPPEVATWAESRGVTDIRPHWNPDRNLQGWRCTTQLDMHRIDKFTYNKFCNKTNEQALVLFKKETDIT
ncbi:hypothetical protein_gp228 [Bacillus phage vB_BceM_WH1]|nr:hypothetical protein_gp228 [Bacillus phage vB_BceM_WH1]